MLLWIIAGIAFWIGVALAVRELVAGTTLRRLRRELIAEALPSALTGASPEPPSLHWVTATNLPAPTDRPEPARTPELVHPE